MTDTPLPLPTLLTRPEVAALLRCQVGYLAAAAMTHRGPRCLKIGRAVRYDPADVRAWLDENAAWQ